MPRGAVKEIDKWKKKFCEVLNKGLITAKQYTLDGLGQNLQEKRRWWSRNMFS